jgi:Protein of unknown function (DUF4229)
VSAMYKYTLGRVVLFVVILAALTPIPLNLLVKLMIALFASAGFSYFLLARWRNEMAEQLASASDRRKRERTRLRAALAGDDQALAAGDRAAQPAAAATNRPAAAKDHPAAGIETDSPAEADARDESK